MTNIISPKLGLDPTHGRSVVDRLTRQASERVRSMSRSRPFVVFVIISTVALALYYFILAVPIYVSESSFQLRGKESPGPAAGLLSAIGGGGGGGSGVSSTDVAALLEYMQSYDMATKLDRRFHLRDVYAQPRLDFLNYLPRNASREDYLDFYRKMVRLKVDHDTQLISIEVRAFNPALSQQMAKAILSIASDYINNLSQSVHHDTVRTSETELKKAEDASRDARLALTEFRARTGTIDPLTSAASTSAGVAGMQEEILQTRAEMTQMLSFNTPNSPQVKQLQARIDGLQQQIDAERRRIANVQANGSIDQNLREFEALSISADYAERQLVAARTASDMAQSLASQRERFIVQVLPPDLPETATEPHRLTSFLEALFVLIAVYGVVALAIAGVRDHQGI